MRDPDTTKWDYGHALIVAGSYGRCGCAVLATRAALRSGCGLATVHVPTRCVDILQTSVPEAMVDMDESDTLFTTPPTHLDRYNAIAVGPGIGTTPATAHALETLLHNRPATSHLILDADALNLIAEHRTWLECCRGAVLTPHAREYQRLFGLAAPADIAVKYGLYLVCKAHHTQIYAPDGRLYTNQTGNAGMATAGSGDVLTGILVGMAAQLRAGADLFPAVCKAVSTHGKIGDLWTAKHSESSLIASDLVENLCDVSTEITAH